MNIIFLDVDGVLNSLDYFESLKSNETKVNMGHNEIDERKLPILKQIVEDNNAYIVLSSTWRDLDDKQNPSCQKMYQYLINTLAKYEMKIISKTPVINFNRPLEIKTWLDNRVNKDEINWISLDDDFIDEKYEEYGLGGHLIKTYYFTSEPDDGGLQEEHVELAKKLFNKQMEEKKMPVNDNLGTRMKEYYENIPKTKLMRRTPVIIRIDGKAFHTFTRGFQIPFDEVLIKTMQETTKYLCENIQGCVLGYTQSDEISLVLVDYQRFETSAWFDYKIQKMCSIAASMTTMAFTKFFRKNVEEFSKSKDVIGYNGQYYGDYNDAIIQLATYEKAIEKGAMFDARVFNIPKEEVTNCIYWRQLDATRNSIQMVGQANFSHKELQKKSCNDIQDMLMTQKGINWNDLPTYQKRGTCVVKNKIVIDSDGITETAMLRDTTKSENEWIIDKDIPVFKGEGREYIEKLINFD